MDHIKGVFFDLHGTILLSDDIDGAWDRWARAFHAALEEKGAEISFDGFKAVLQNLFEGPVPDIHEAGFTLFMKRVKVLGESIGLDLPKEEVRPLVDTIIKVWHQGMYLDEEAVPIIERLKEKYKVGLVTNWEHTPRIYELLGELGAEELFDCVVVSDSVGHAKPDPRVFNPAFNLTDVKAEESLYVGDMDVDIEGAINAGMQPVLIKRVDANGDWDQFSEKSVCSYSDDQYILIQRLSQLLDLLNC
ncbi:HAD family hydrolase [Candidatus Bathyarchaeota archaeon]|jgi:putative hydrolase of the HAD superfamily|nr:HAD family hydrolase [Candidatus Bathyarchaeota archaeon]MBT4319162.1 HAD family hydrolase [Candidatus Bathyarchaeota archaeon]MBT4423424.1 HAD family hydrolase [Candidatus Bathyarchaeota archaeon]MBT6605380.1 HAD family hydrolase [Candidatus Bathyarchaeota archaeon]MBT7186245.1 HAD family hydrolase [Candidatus Bathyarchaeota archaeon]